MSLRVCCVYVLSTREQERTRFSFRFVGGGGVRLFFSVPSPSSSSSSSHHIIFVPHFKKKIKKFFRGHHIDGRAPVDKDIHEALAMLAETHSVKKKLSLDKKFFVMVCKKKIKTKTRGWKFFRNFFFCICKKTKTHTYSEFQQHTNLFCQRICVFFFSWSSQGTCSQTSVTVTIEFFRPPLSVSFF